jgi:hypothetical protein
MLAFCFIQPRRSHSFRRYKIGLHNLADFNHFQKSRIIFYQKPCAIGGYIYNSKLINWYADKLNLNTIILLSLVWVRIVFL